MKDNCIRLSLTECQSLSNRKININPKIPRLDVSSMHCARISLDVVQRSQYIQDLCDLHFLDQQTRRTPFVFCSNLNLQAKGLCTLRTSNTVWERKLDGSKIHHNTELWTQSTGGDMWRVSNFSRKVRPVVMVQSSSPLVPIVIKTEVPLDRDDLVIFISWINKQEEHCLPSAQILTSKYQSIVDNRMKIECASNVINVREYSRSNQHVVLQRRNQWDCFQSVPEELGNKKLFLKYQSSTDIALATLPAAKHASNDHLTNVGFVEIDSYCCNTKFWFAGSSFSKGTYVLISLSLIDCPITLPRCPDLSWRDSYSSHMFATAPKRLSWFAETIMWK